MNCCCVGKLRRGTWNIFRSVWDNWSASFSWSVCWRSFGHTARKEEKREGERRDLVLGQDLVPIRPEALGRFVCTGRKSQRRMEAAWCCSSQLDCHRQSISCSASLSFPSCPRPRLCILPFHPVLWNNVQKGLLNCSTRESRGESSCQSLTILEIEPCDGYFILQSQTGGSNKHAETGLITWVGP